MQFIWSWLSPVLLIIPLLTILYIRALHRRARFPLRYSSILLSKQAVEKNSRVRRHLPAAYFIASLAVMLIALLRPVYIVTLPKQEGTVLLALDVSGSMRAEDMKPNRFEAMRTAAREFIKRQSPDTHLGIVAFSGYAQLVFPPSTERDGALEAINRFTMQRGTAVGSAILVSLDAIFEFHNISAPTQSTPYGAMPEPAGKTLPPGTHIPAIIVLLTDGQSVNGPSPIAAARQAADFGIRVYTIGAGTTQGVTLQFGGGGGGGAGFRTALDEKSLKEIAEITGAEYFHASDETALEKIFANLDTQFILRTQRMEITALFTALAVITALIGGALSLLWFNRLP